jgi:hypothetical protein
MNSSRQPLQSIFSYSSNRVPAGGTVDDEFEPSTNAAILLQVEPSTTQRLRPLVARRLRTEKGASSV